MIHSAETNHCNTGISSRSNLTKIEGERIVAWLSGHTDDFADGAAQLVAALEKVVDDPEKFFRCIPEVMGQFALAIEDKATSYTYLLTDLLGTEPLYYCLTKNGWDWSFRIKNLLPAMQQRSLDPRALDEMMLYRWLMEDHTMLHGVTRVLPSHCICLRPNREPLVHRYARIDYNPSPETASEFDLIEKTDEALDKYFSRLRCRYARVAVFFSGGVDSSLLIAKARAYDFERLVAVTCQFVGHQNPEIERAREVAAHLAVEHRIVDVTDSFIAECIPGLVWQCESPVSYFNNVAREAMFQSVESDVDVVLTGEGADGMFSMEVGSSAGALRYQAKRKFIDWVPSPLLTAGAKALSAFNHPIASRISRLLAQDTLSFLRGQGALFNPGKGMSAISAEDLIPSLREIRQNRSAHFYHEYEPADFEKINANSVIKFCQNRGLYTQNRHQYFCYASLAAEHGLIVAMPFLSGDIMPIGLHLQNSLRSDQYGPKPILKKLTCRYLPEALVYAPKMGFETPLEEWLSGAHSNWRAILSDQRTKQRALFDQEVVDKLEVKRDALLIWTAMVLEMFIRQFIDGDGFQNTIIAR